MHTPSQQQPCARPLRLAAFFVLLALTAGTCPADEPAPAETERFAELTPLDPTGMEALRGRAGDSHITLSSQQDLQATVNGSLIEAGTMTSGSVTIAERALDNFGGIGLFNIVTGSNNAVDAAIGVNFNLQ